MGAMIEHTISVSESILSRMGAITEEHGTSIDEVLSTFCEIYANGSMCGEPVGALTGEFMASCIGAKPEVFDVAREVQVDREREVIDALRKIYAGVLDAGDTETRLINPVDALFLAVGSRHMNSSDYQLARKYFDKLSLLWKGQRFATFDTLVANCLALYGGWPPSLYGSSFEYGDVSEPIRNLLDSAYRPSRYGVGARLSVHRRLSEAYPYDKPVGDGLATSSMFISEDGSCNHALDEAILRVFEETERSFRTDFDNFDMHGDSLCSMTVPPEVYIRTVVDDITGDKSYEVTDEFLRFLAREESWDFAHGAFREGFCRLLESGDIVLDADTNRMVSVVPSE